MSRKKALVGAVLVMVMTFLATSGAFVYFLQGATATDFATTLKVFRALQVIKSRYVEEVPVETLAAGAVKGMVQSLGDPHSVYMDAKMYKEFMVETEGSFGGVGIVIGVKDKVLTVVSPIEGTPGEKAGIKSGDQILKIDGKDTKEMALDEAVGKIRGPEGTQVTLTIRRAEQEDREYALTRSNIQIKTVSGKMLPDDIGYIRIAMFNETTGKDLNQKYEELQKQGMKAVILDLRDNPGGLLEESVKVSGKFVPPGNVVTVIRRDGTRETHESKTNTPSLPLVVLINQGSASASEIVAGAVQDRGTGTLVGTKTYGKGSVQTLFPLGNSGAIKLTFAKYLTPNDRSINGIGIEPDEKVELPEGAKSKTAADEFTDTQLNRAVEIIKSKLQ
ncbi:MAG TPA: S41 family peptidase [Patescibacteria group bacterium]|nr:S41 family peptidase [Patescibacteria group bacterium]